MLKKEKKGSSLKTSAKKKAAKKQEENANLIQLEIENRAYEAMFVLDADLSESKRKEKFNEIKNALTQVGGKITFEDESWGTRKLCYKIKGKWYGFYYVLNFTLDPKELIELSKQWNIDNEILRNLVVKLPESYVPRKYTEIKDKYEVETYEEKREKALNKRKKQQQKRDEVKREPVLVEEVRAEKVEVKVEEKHVASKEVEKKVDLKEDVAADKKQEASSDDHLKELNDKLDKLLLSDDITNL